MKTVGIIGGSGFIGSYITKKFLSENYKVKVSATDISKKEKYAHLSKLRNSENMEVVPLDVQDMDQLKAFAKGCNIIVHGGTPFQLDVKDPQSELFDPTIKGTENFLEVIHKTPGIEKVVLIASVAAFNTNFPMPAGGKTAADSLSEKDAPFISEESHPYAQAKFIANQTVDKFIKAHPVLPFEVTTVSPVMVMGKSLSDREDSTSTGLQFLFKNKIAPNPFIQMFYDNDVEFAIVSVNDVAEGVFNAATTAHLHGKNYLLSSESYPVSDVSLMLNGQSPKHSAKVIYQNHLAKQELKLPFQSVQKTLQEYNN